MSSQDCVVTSFFIDCAHNVVEFIELIHRILKPGGKWINFGPLLYHFAEIPRESSIEPSYDIVRSIIEKTGFEFKREGTLNTSIVTDQQSSLQKFVSIKELELIRRVITYVLFSVFNT